MALAPRRRASLFVAALALSWLLSSCLLRDDSLAPVVAIREPASGTTRTTEALRIVGYAMDDEGIASIEVDGTDLLDFDVYAGERGKRFIEFVFTIPNLSEGETTSQIVVQDVKGRTSTLLHTIRIDVTPPSLELLEVRDLADGQLRIEGVARDDVAVSAIRINEVPLQFAASPEHRFALVVTAERDALIVVEDSAGNTVERSLE